MHGLAHLLFAVNICLLISLFYPLQLHNILLASVIFSLCIDMDHWFSEKRQRSNDHLKTWIQEPFGLVFVALPIALILWYFLSVEWFILTLVTYGSHILLDYLSKNESSPLAPFNKKAFKRADSCFFIPIGDEHKFKKGIHENVLNGFLILIFILCY